MLACVRTGGRIRDRGLHRRRRSRRVVRTSGLHDGRSSRCVRSREPRPRPQRDPQLRVRIPRASRHRQSRACRRSQGRILVRSADRAGRARGQRRGHAARMWTTCWCSANCRWTAASIRRAAFCRSRRRHGASASAGCCCRRPNRAEAAVVEGLELYAGVDRSTRRSTALNDPTRSARSPSADRRRWQRRRHRRRRFRRRARSGAGPACAGDRRRGRPQHADDRPAGFRQDDDGATGARHPAAAGVRRGARGHVDSFGRRAARRRPRADDRAAVSRAASHDLRRGAGRRRIAAAARRDQPRASRRAVPRRDGGIQSQRARGPATAAGGRLRADRAGAADSRRFRPASC